MEESRAGLPRRDADALEEFGIEALFDLLLQVIRFRIGLRLRAILPAIRERFGSVNHAFAFLAPPVDHQLVIVRESDFVDAGRSLAAFARERDVSIAHFQIIYRMSPAAILVPKPCICTVWCHGTVLSEPRRLDPKTLVPAGPRRDALEFPICSGMRQVERVGDRGHGLKADKIASRRGVHHGNRIFRAIDHRDALPGALHPELRRAIGPAHQAGEDVIELRACQRVRIGELDRLMFAGGNQLVAEDHVVPRREVHLPLVARGIVEVKIGVEPDADR